MIYIDGLDDLWDARIQALRPPPQLTAPIIKPTTIGLRQLRDLGLTQSAYIDPAKEGEGELTDPGFPDAHHQAYGR